MGASTYSQPAQPVEALASGGQRQEGGRGQRSGQSEVGGFLCNLCFFHGGLVVGSWVVGGLMRRGVMGEAVELSLEGGLGGSSVGY